MTLTQLAVGIIILMCQAVTTVMNEDFNTAISNAESQKGLIFWYGLGLPDSAATGIWVGLLVSGDVY